MIKRILSSVSLLCLLISGVAFAGKIKNLSLVYDEVEENAGMQQMRYLINERFLRIDGGQADSDFILFNINSRNVYSVNHADQTILNIEYVKWHKPKFEFKVSSDVKRMTDAPSIDNQPVFHYRLIADNKVCTQVFFIKGMYSKQLKVLHKYQQTLSSQQVKTLANTPEEFQTPCFLLGQVYDDGEYYLKGLPVQISYGRGYAKYLKQYKQVEVDDSLFVLPEGYKEYFPFE